MLRQSAEATSQKEKKKVVGRATPVLCEDRRLLRSGTRRDGEVRLLPGKLHSAVDRVRGSDALEPLKQSQRLWMIGETVERDREGRIGGTFYNVSNFKNVLAGARREARKLIVGGDVVDERRGYASRHVRDLPQVAEIILLILRRPEPFMLRIEAGGEVSPRIIGRSFRQGQDSKILVQRVVDLFRILGRRGLCLQCAFLK
jgi:hypothetical protein